MRKRLFWGVISILAVTLAIASTPAKADTTSAGGVTYTFTSGEADGGGVFDVVLTIDTTGATASGTLTTFAIQAGPNATGAALESVSSNAGTWSFSGFGNVNQCGTGNLPFLCFQGDAITVTSGGQGGLAISNEVGIGTPPTVPEPSSLSMLAVGLVGFLGFIRRRSAA